MHFYSVTTDFPNSDSIAKQPVMLNSQLQETQLFLMKPLLTQYGGFLITPWTQHALCC